MNATYRAEARSSYFRRTLDRLRRTCPDLLAHVGELIQTPLQPQSLERLWERSVSVPGPCERTMAANLRRFRCAAMLVIIERDLGQHAPLPEVLGAITTLASICVRLALQFAAGAVDDAGRRRSDADIAAAARRLCAVDGEPQDLLVVGMGKLGGHELNPSSDVDLVFVSREPFLHPEQITRLIRSTCSLLAELTGDGHVFRVDTRLRPYGDSGPPYSTLTMLEQYFYEQGREWERFAWLKGRVIADSGLTAERARRDESDLMQIVTPFVYRRYLDYDAFSSLARLHDLIRAESARQESRRARGNNAGFDVKLGRGGIREVEFCAQLFQLVRGGQDPTLWRRSTPAALERLAQARIIDPEESQRLVEGWSFLRRIENALQYQEDEQTHWLPDAPQRHEAIAMMLEMDLTEFDARLRTVRAQVSATFDRLLEPTRRESTAPDSSTVEAALAEDARRRLGALRSGRRYQSATGEVRECIERLVARALASGAPAILGQMCVPAGTISASGGAVDPTGIAALCDLIEAIIGRPAYLRMLDEHPRAFERLLVVLARGGWGARYLVQHPIVIDELLDGQLFDPFDARRWCEELRPRLQSMVLQPQLENRSDGNTVPDVERRMDAVRSAHHAATFRLLVQDLSGRLSVEALGDQLSALADETLRIGIEEVWSQLPRRHRDEPQFAAIAYGKLGGLELGYASDLDLVFLYDEEQEQEDATQDASTNYVMLAQRLSAWLSTRTAAGQLFDIDLRLRPNGNSGLLVSSVRAFCEYQLRSAWLWEHQALTRARYSAGLPRIGERFEALRREILAQPRDPEQLASQILGMRQKMHEGHPNRSRQFDLKHDEGGMVDIEFIVQYLVLGHASRFPDLIDNRGNIELLRRSARHGLIDPELAQVAGNAYRQYRQLQHAMRLAESSYARVAPDRLLTEREQIRRLWRAVFGDRNPVAPRSPG